MTAQILFIANGSIGDAVIATGILGYLMDTNPDAAFTVAASPLSAPLFKACPRVSRVHVMQKLPWNKHWLRLWAATKDTQWDTIIDLRGSVIGFILNAKQRIVFKNPNKMQSKAQQLAALLDLNDTPPPRLWSTDEARTSARSLLPSGKAIVVLAPKTNSLLKDWPIDNFAELARRIQRTDTIFAVLATQLQQPGLQKLFRILPAAQVLDLSGRTDLLTAYAVMEQAKLFIGNDSGLLHMAAAANIPCVGIYGPTNDKTYAPTGSHVRIVKAQEFMPGEEEKQDGKLIKSVTVEAVENAIRELNVL